MADVQNFVIPESNFGGLYKLGDTIERKQDNQEEVARQQTARKGATASFLANYLDPKDSLTGTNYDPQIVKGFDDLLQEGTKLAAQGADANMIMMALSPGVAKLNQYSTTAKLLNQRIKEQLTQIPANAGYDKSNLEQVTKRTAFYDDNGQLKDINTIDPSVDWLTETIKKYPDQVTTDAAIDEFVKSSPKFTNTQSVKRINSRGGYEYKKAKVTAPSWAVVDEEGNIVPRYEVALEGGKPHSFDFGTGKGTTADIRLMNEKDFDSLMGSNPGIADWVRGQVMRAGEGVDLSTPQAKNAARAIMYDELKRRGGGGIEDIEEIKDNPAPKISVRISNNLPKSGDESNINDLYSRIKNKVQSAASSPKFNIASGMLNNSERVSNLAFDESNLIVDFVNKSYPDKGVDEKPKRASELYLKEDENGNINVYDDKENNYGTLPSIGTNIKVQPGVKEKREVIAGGGKSKNMDAYKTDKTATNWRNNGDGTYTYLPTGQKIDSKTGKLK